MRRWLRDRWQALTGTGVYHPMYATYVRWAADCEDNATRAQELADEVRAAMDEGRGGPDGHSLITWADALAHRERARATQLRAGRP